MQSRLTTLNTAHGFKQGAQPFFFHEVIDRNDGAVRVDEYFDLGIYLSMVVRNLVSF
jgi:alpha-amylase